jgi:hypothetical protein
VASLDLDAFQADILYAQLGVLIGRNINLVKTASHACMQELKSVGEMYLRNKLFYPVSLIKEEATLLKRTF